jgi:hypothetical protein
MSSTVTKRGAYARVLDISAKGDRQQEGEGVPSSRPHRMTVASIFTPTL